MFKLSKGFVLAIIISSNCFSQNVVQTFHQDSISSQEITKLKEQFGKNKTIPKDFETQTLLALSYFPELKDIKIKFRLKNRTTPLATRPLFFSMFQASKKRTYIITISNKSTSYLNAITLKNLNFNAQIGVLGHELCHVSDYLNKGFGKMNRIGLDIIFSKKRIDTFEFNTDKSCIDHGLGYQLLDWSISVRENLKRPNWLGAVNLAAGENSERYMNPNTITNIINNHPLYKQNTIQTQNCQEKE